MWYIKRMFLLGHFILRVMSENPCPASLHDASLINCKDKSAVRIVRLKNTTLPRLDVDFFSKFPRLVELQITDVGLSNIEGIFSELKTVQSIDLSENRVDHVKSTSFKNLPNLTKLSMNYNAITKIDAHSFSSLVKLRELYLSENCIESLSAKAFGNGSSLLKLELYKNRLTHVGFLRNLNALEYLDLSSNSIGRIHLDDFASMARLRFFHCSRNELSDLRFLESAPNLRYLDLRHNLVESIPIDVFNTFKDATQISLSHNKIRRVDSGTFSELKNLETLDLSYNLLVHAGEILAYLPRLKSLRINGNRLRKFAFTKSGNVVVFIDGNQWFCEFVAELCKAKNVVLNYTFHSNVSHYQGIPCVDDVGTRNAMETKKLDEDSPSDFYVYLSGFAGVFSVTFALVFVLVLSLRKFVRRKEPNQERNMFYMTFPRSDGSGYMTPNAACQNIYEEIQEISSIRQQSDSCTI